MPMDFDSLKQVGAMIGSGGLVVMDEDTCMVEVARFFMNFTQNESCGKCVPCREGTRRMLEILTRIVNNEGSMEIWTCWRTCPAPSPKPPCAAWVRAPASRFRAPEIIPGRVSGPRGGYALSPTVTAGKGPADRSRAV